MPEEIPSSSKIRREAYDAIIGSYRARLSALQREARSLGISCTVVVEGAVRAVRARLISGLMRGLDPQGTRVCRDSAPGRKDRRFPYMRRYWLALPARGETAIYDRGWYRERDGNPPSGILDDIRSLERQACEDGLTVKLLLQMPRKALRKACGRAGGKRLTGKRYRTILRTQDMLQAESTAGIPWTVLAADNARTAEVLAYEAIIAGLGAAVSRVKAGAPAAEPAGGKEDPVAEMPLDRMEPGSSLEKKEYRRHIKKARKRLRALTAMLKVRGIPLVILAEALDKDTAERCVRFLARAFCGGMARIISDGDYEESDSLYPGMRRFYRLLPPGGKAALFQHSWYAQALGRDEACRLAVGCSRGDITALERQIAGRGVLAKLWLQAPSANEDPGQVTDCPACEETLLRTDTVWAPWAVIDAGNWRYARAASLDAVIAAIKSGMRGK